MFLDMLEVFRDRLVGTQLAVAVAYLEGCSLGLMIMVFIARN